VTLRASPFEHPRSDYTFRTGKQDARRIQCVGFKGRPAGIFQPYRTLTLHFPTCSHIIDICINNGIMGA
jgi:hypothetical protein